MVWLTMNPIAKANTIVPMSPHIPAVAAGSYLSRAMAALFKKEPAARRMKGEKSLGDVSQTLNDSAISSDNIAPNSPWRFHDNSLDAAALLTGSVRSKSTNAALLYTAQADCQSRLCLRLMFL